MVYEPTEGRRNNFIEITEGIMDLVLFPTSFARFVTAAKDRGLLRDNVVYPSYLLAGLAEGARLVLYHEGASKLSEDILRFSTM